MLSASFFLHIMDSHIYPGVQIQVAQSGLPDKGPCPVEFSDGTVVLAGCHKENAKSWILDVPSYQTGKGTTVVAKSWRISCNGSDRWIIRRLS